MTDISIIVPVYNVEQYLDECVHSLILQDINSYELILVDDGSTDTSGCICDSYAEQYEFIRVVHKKNGGLGSARNAGLVYAKGKYILFIDSDDYLEDNCLSHLLAIAEKDQLDILLFGAESFSEDNEEILSDYSRKNAQYNKIKTGIEAIQSDFKNNEYITSVCLRLMRKQFILETDILFNEMYIHEDEDFSFLTYIQAKRVEIIPEKYYKRRYRSGSILLSRTFQKFFEGYKFAAESILRHSKELEDEMQSLCCKYHDRLVLSIVKQYCNLERKSHYTKEIKNYLREEKKKVKTNNMKLALAYKSLCLFNFFYHGKQMLKIFNKRM